MVSKEHEMNERIRELHKQVMRWNDTPDCSYNAEFCVPEEYTQKLAELILTEVIATIYRTDISDRKQEQLVSELTHKFGFDR